MYNPTKPIKETVLILIKSTWKSPYITIKENTYSIIKRRNNFLEVDHTDGIGTKGWYHWEKKSFKNAVLDSLAMNLNDLALVRAVPFKLQNHIVLPKDDDEAVLAIVSALVKECKKRKIAITGGETSIEDTSTALDIGITMSGFIKKEEKNQFHEGDIVIGIPSSGLHSNGISKVRELFGDEIRKEFITPTTIYLDDILLAANKYPIHGMMHITGGAFTKLKDLLHRLDIIIEKDHAIQPQKIFYEIHEEGVSDEEMYKTFNCGIGFVVSTPPKYAEKVMKIVKGKVIGKIIPGTGKIRIESKFSSRTVIY